MKAIYIYIIILFSLLQVTNTNAQTITKTASKSSVYIGEEFTYTIAIENINNFSDLDQIIDDFGLDTDIIRVRYSPSIQLLTTWQFCSGVSHTINSTTTSNELIVNFSNCSGSTSMVNRLYIEVDVRLNDLACSLTTKDNRANLVLKNPARTISAKHHLPIDYTNPLEVQKSFFKYDNGYLYYDIRLSSKTGNFRYIDFSSESFLDEFTIPSCFQNVSINDIETIYHPNGNRTIDVPVIPNSRNLSGNQLSIDWSFPSSITEMFSSILFSVKIKVTDCQCNNLFDLNNTASFKFQNVCGTDFIMADSFDLQGLTCDIENSLPSDCQLEFSKKYEFYDNDLGLTMKGCEGEYLIKVKNCSTNLEFEKILLSDLVPSELDILGIDSGTWSHNQSGNQMTLNANLSPGDSFQVKIKFRVNTNLPNKTIENCADIDIWGSHKYTNAPIQLNKTVCTDFKTVPNEVTVVTRKSICSTAEKDCGTLEINSNSNNNYLPNDDVEYELFFYNYGNKDGENVIITDRLPNYLRVINPNTNIKVYKAESGNPDLMKSCDLTDYMDITSNVDINYSPSNLNQLDIKLDKHILDAFTCKGVSFYKVVVKGRIQQTAQSGIYDNQFIVEYNEPPSSIRKNVISQKESYSINIDNLILGYKQAPTQVPDCENHTLTATYRVLVANMGTMPVNVDIVDALQNLPTNVGIVTGPDNFRGTILNGTQSFPTAPLPSINPVTAFSNFSSTNTGFSIIRETLQPCTALLLEYDVVFDTELLNEGEIEEVCNDVNIWAYTGNRRVTPRIFSKNPKKYNNNIVVSMDPALNAMYTNAKTSQERLDAILLMKLKKANPELIKKPNNFNVSRFQNMNQIDRRRLYPWFTGTYFGKDTYGDVCFNVKDCLAGKESGCINSNGTNDVSLEITGIDTSTGEISTQLNIINKDVSRIEYVLSDVEFSEFCNEEVFYLGSRPRTIACRQCDGNLAGEFRPTNTNAISGLNYTVNPTINFSSIGATYKEWNTAYYEGSPTMINTVNKEFILPNIGNCSGNYAFSITAIVYFEDCTSCYASDAIDFRTYYNWLLPDIHTGHNLGGSQYTPVLSRPFTP